MMRYMIKYGTCDGTGPHTVYVSDNNVIDAILKSKIDVANVISIGPAKRWANGPRLDFKDWCELNQKGEHFVLDVPPELEVCLQQAMNIMFQHMKWITEWCEEQIP